MNPAWSVVLLTTLVGAAQGLVLTLAVTRMAGLSMAAGVVGHGLLVALALLVAGLAASFAHLGRPERAWRAARMWRTSWLSREVIVLPALIGVVALWWLAEKRGVGALASLPALPPAGSPALPLAALVLAILLWVCTTMIYACLRFIREWAHPLTFLVFVSTGLASGSLVASVLAAHAHETALLAASGPFAGAATVVAGALRLAALRRNAGLQPRSTLQSATGIAAPRLTQISMGMTAGSFNTREFFHGRTEATLERVRRGFLVFGFLLPSVLMALAVALPVLASAPAPGTATALWTTALLVQAPGLVAERWYFFAEARHPQNLYYQTVT